MDDELTPDALVTEQGFDARPWSEVAPAFAKQFPDLDQGMMEKRYNQARGVAMARQSVATEANPGAVDVLRTGLPFTGPVLGAMMETRYQKAQERVKSGEGDEEDWRAIASRESFEKNRAERSGAANLGMSVLGGARFAAEATIGGIAGKAVGLGAGAAGAAGLTSAAGTGSVEQAAERASEKDDNSRFYSPENIVPAASMQAAQALMFGAAGKWAQGFARPFTRTVAEIGAGMSGNQAVDAAAGLADEFLKPAWKTNTGYGIIGKLVNGHSGQAMQQAAGEAVTLALLSLMHGGSKEHADKVMEGLQTTLDEQSKAGATPDQAAAVLREKLQPQSSDATGDFLKSMGIEFPKPPEVQAAPVPPREAATALETQLRQAQAELVDAKKAESRERGNKEMGLGNSHQEAGDIRRELEGRVKDLQRKTDEARVAASASEATPPAPPEAPVAPPVTPEVAQKPAEAVPVEVKAAVTPEQAKARFDELTAQRKANEAADQATDPAVHQEISDILKEHPEFRETSVMAKPRKMAPEPVEGPQPPEQRRAAIEARIAAAKSPEEKARLEAMLTPLHEALDVPEATPADKLRAVFAETGLDAREQFVLAKMGEGLNGPQIAKLKEMGLNSRQRVSQIMDGARGKIQAYLKSINSEHTVESFLKSIRPLDKESNKQDLTGQTKVTKDAKSVIDYAESSGHSVEDPEDIYHNKWLTYLGRTDEARQALNPEQHAAHDRSVSEAIDKGEEPPASGLIGAAHAGAEGTPGLAPPVRPESTSAVQPHTPSGSEAPTQEVKGSQGLGGSTNAGNAEAAGNKLKAGDVIEVPGLRAVHEPYRATVKEVKANGEYVIESDNGVNYHFTPSRYVDSGGIKVVQPEAAGNKLIDHPALEDIHSVNKELAAGLQKHLSPAEVEQADQLAREQVSSEAGIAPEGLKDALLKPDQPAGGAGPVAAASDAGTGSEPGQPGNSSLIDSPGPTGGAFRRAISDFASDEAGSLDLDKVKEFAADAKERFLAGAKAFSMSIRSFGHEMYPITGEHSPATQDKMATFATSRQQANRAKPYFIDKVLGEKVTPEQSKLWMTTLQESRLRYAAAEATARGDTEAAQRASRTFVGQKDSALPDEATYAATLKDPDFLRAVQNYKQDFVPVMEEYYKQATGRDQADDIDSLTQIPGLPVPFKAIREGDTGGTPLGSARGSLAAQKLRKLGASKEAKFSADAYETDFREVISHIIDSRIETANKHEMFRTAVAEDRAHWDIKGPERKTMEDGTIRRLMPNVEPPKGTQENKKGQTSLYVDEPIWHDMKNSLNMNESGPGTQMVRKATNLFNAANLFVSTGEFLSHGSNQVSMFLTKPGMRFSDLFSNIKGAYENNAAFKEKMMDLARLGADKPSYAEKDNASLLKLGSRMLDGLSDVMRATASDAYDRLAAKAQEGGLAFEDTAAAKRNFVNQLGKYERRSQNGMVRWLRDSGIGPFATAGTNYVEQSVRSLGLDPGLKGSDIYSKTYLRANFLKNISIAAGAVAALNYVLWGRVDGDDRTPFGNIKYGEWGGKSHSVDLSGPFLVKRGLRTTGLLSMIEGQRGASPTTTNFDKATEDVMHAFLHPTMGPAAQAALTMATGKNTIGMQVAEKAKEGESQKVKNVKAALLNVNPIVAEATGTARPNDKRPAVERFADLLGPLAPRVRQKPVGNR